MRPAFAMLACLWTLGAASVAHAAFDLSVTFVQPGALPGGQTDAGRPLTFKVKIVNNGPDAYPGGFSLNLNRFDHTGQQFLAQVGSAQPVNALAVNHSVELTFTDQSPPQGSYFYKVGFTPYFTDGNNTNHKPDKFVKFVTPALTVKVRGAGRVQLNAPPVMKICDKSECTFELAPNTNVTLVPQGKAASGPPAGQPKFRRWQLASGQVVCSGTATCRFTFTHSVELRAVFMSDLDCQMPGTPEC